MKRFGLVLLVVLCIVAVMSCGGKQNTAAKGKITVWCWDPNFNGYSMQKAAEVYKKINPDVTIEVVDIPENIEGKIEAGLQAGGAGLPDIALFQDYVIERFIQNYPGAFVDLKAEGIDYTKFAQYKLGPMTDGNKVYGIPFDTGSTGFFIRADMLQAAGLNPDDYKKNLTWSELIDLGIKIKAKIGKPLIAYDTTSFDFLRIMVQSTGTQFFNPDGSVNLTSQAMVKSIEILKALNDKGLLYMTEGWNNWLAAFNGGDAAGMLTAIWIIGTLKSQPQNSGKWMVIPTPLVEGVPGAQNASNNGGSSWYVFSKAPNKAAAIDFMKKTWASDSQDALEFYNTILKGAGAMGTFLPSRVGSNYTAPDDFFYNKQAVYKDFAEWMEKVPSLKYTPNYVAMRTAVNNALNKMFNAQLKDPEAVIKAAIDEYQQATGNK
ncbi:ABC transporter substrate-binding protein [Gracilinema caldarium]|uniref:Extracellular solute-binding protein family 1 n=1 Tax=Gracilinema caldarium (strain ATCC 51460 / DSM 7334 / H1) TaxID=744872 RepID=F8EYT3_GRAC1|nr:extracellular solute-binding protein [Gracilinema caldarium]AEJ18879.1 extracellular solute-binding protein family 1 [Gracilinema caldarium DSM 7334]